MKKWSFVTTVSVAGVGVLIFSWLAITTAGKASTGLQSSPETEKIQKVIEEGLAD